MLHLARLFPAESTPWLVFVVEPTIVISDFKANKRVVFNSSG